METYIRAFVIGSSIPVTLSFLLTVMALKHKNYSYETYSIVAPLYFGLMNVLATMTGLPLQIRLFYTSIVSILIVLSIVTYFSLYTYSRDEWRNYAIRISLRHLITYNLILYFLELYV